MGVIPAGGGTTELAVRALEAAGSKGYEACVNAVKEAVERIAAATMSENAENAKELGFIRSTDKTITDLPTLVYEAKKACMEICKGFKPFVPRKYKTLGPKAYETIKASLTGMRETGRISPYDEVLGGRIAFIMTGGDLPSGTEVSEQHFLDLEREEYVKACQDKRTYERITSLLNNGVKLRN